MMLAALTACGGDGDGDADAVEPDVAEFTYRERILKIDDAATAWKNADNVEIARSAAESAANLVVGPGGPGYGDRDGDGTIEGENDFGVLPGLDGSPVGLANALTDNVCIEDDVLAGSWDDPAGRWASMQTAIDEWTTANNTMSSLASRPMRIVGWATFTLATDSLDDAHSYGGQAALEVAQSLGALDC